MREEETVIQVSEVAKTFGSRAVLDGISLNIPRAEIFGLLGPSGAGKTTLVKIMTGIDVADKGEVWVLGEQIPKLQMLKQMGYMAQSDALYAELTAKENLEFFASLFGLKGAERKKRIEEVMTLVHLQDDLNKRIEHYSGGMKRRLSLAIALLHNPQLLILDEPTVGIDPVLRKSIWEELSRLSKEGTTIIVTTHVMDEAYKCHRLGMLRDGQLIAVGTPEELMNQSGTDSIEEAFLFYGGGVQA